MRSGLAAAVRAIALVAFASACSTEGATDAAVSPMGTPIVTGSTTSPTGWTSEPTGSESETETTQPNPPPPDQDPTDDRPRTNALVTRVIDGDTVEVRFRDRALTVRLIGIDTPESVAPGEPVGCFALRSSAYTANRLEGERVRLEFDVEKIDPFGRTLAYVWLGNELFNETLVRGGFAFVTTFPPNVKYVDRFQDAQRHARAADRGVWGRCVQDDACDPAYPDACIPPPPPDLDCDDVDQRRFTVRSPDPHRFDGDGNGIGCEST
jgi:micrococcal nuclease